MTELKTLFHKSDPETSREAAEQMVKSGKLTEQENFIHYVIEVHRGHKSFTAKELAKDSGEDYYIIQRRLSGLHRKGKIERTGEKRNGCCVWRLTQ